MGTGDERDSCSGTGECAGKGLANAPRRPSDQHTFATQLHMRMVTHSFVRHARSQKLSPVSNPRAVQISVGFVSALVFGGFYLVFIYALVRGREWIRLSTFFFAGMIVMSPIVYLAVGILGDAPLFALACGPGSGFDYKSPNPLASVAMNGFYSLVALLFAARMRRPHPFTRRAR
jgi:hypothetical protein